MYTYLPMSNLFFFGKPVRCGIVVNQPYFNKKFKKISAQTSCSKNTLNTPNQVSSHPPPNTKWYGEGDWFHDVPHELFCTILTSLNKIYDIIDRIKF